MMTVVNMKFNFYIAQIARGVYSWEFLVGNFDVPSGSSNPDPVSDQKMLFSTPVFRPDF